MSERTTEVALALMRMALGLLDQAEHHGAAACLQEAIRAMPGGTEVAAKVAERSAS